MQIQAIEPIARAIGVDTPDVLSMVNIVQNSIEQTGMREIFLGMSEAERINIVQAYTSAEVKKFNEFCVSLLTNTEKKSAFDQYLFHKLQETLWTLC